ncbi:WW domain-binding protein 1-like, partial [Ascaphus truei]|uniref:WW domain-binding protein 1-like n=1 Tax=Ascaphus truei TaxID=8439 RepID=UPI003F590459
PLAHAEPSLLSQQAQEQCPGVNNQPYACETGHCCGETGCCTYYYELWWFWLLWTVLILLSCCCAYRHRRAKLRLQHQQRQRQINLIAYQRACHYPPSMLDLRVLASFKLPAYEEVAERPCTPPPPYCATLTRLDCSPPPAASLTPSSDPSSSCSCESGCLTTASSSSFSVQVTDETGTSPGSTASEGSSWAQSPEEEAGDPAPHKQAAFSSYVDFFEGERHYCSDIAEEDEGSEEEHYRHRRLTGDSGIEVCRCQIQGGGGEEEDGGGEVHSLHDNPGCAERCKGGESPCEKGGSDPDSPEQPV